MPVRGLTLGILLALAGHPGFVSSAVAQPAAAQSDVLAAYNDAIARFKAILRERRAQIDAKQPLPNLPGQAVYNARTNLISTYKDLTDAQPAKIGRPNKFGIPPAHFDADNEPLIDEYVNLFASCRRRPPMRKTRRRRSRMLSTLRPPSHGHGPDAANADIAGRISWACSLPRPTAIRISAMRAPTSTRAAFRPACLKVKTATQMGRDQAVDRSLRSATDRPRRQGRGARRQYRPPLQSLDRCTRRLMNAHAELFTANSGDRGSISRSDRPDEVLRADPDRSFADQVALRSGNRSDTGFPTRP